MKVKDLIEALQEANPEIRVVLSCDGGANKVSPLVAVTPEFYLAESDWAGEFRDDDDDDGEESEFVIALWPAN